MCFCSDGDLLCNSLTLVNNNHEEELDTKMGVVNKM